MLKFFTFAQVAPNTRSRRQNEEEVTRHLMEESNNEFEVAMAESQNSKQGMKSNPCYTPIVQFYLCR